MILWSRATEPELAAEPQETARERRVAEWQETDQCRKRAFGKETKALFNLRKSRYTVEKSTGVNTNEISAMH